MELVQKFNQVTKSQETDKGTYITSSKVIVVTDQEENKKLYGDVN